MSRIASNAKFELCSAILRAAFPSSRRAGRHEVCAPSFSGPPPVLRLVAAADDHHLPRHPRADHVPAHPARGRRRCRRRLALLVRRL
eukprot:4074008-Pleurochrysis_carterae.AAC.3